MLHAEKIQMPPALGAAVIGFGWCSAGGAGKEASGLEVYVDIQLFLANGKLRPETDQGFVNPVLLKIIPFPEALSFFLGKKC